MTKRREPRIAALAVGEWGAAALPDRALLELVLLVGSYACLAMVFESCGIELDPELADYRAPRLDDRET